jgi:alpha-tubulin suppressor-like RCC1 family protein
MVDRRLSRVAVLSSLLGAMGLNALAFAQSSGTVECFGAGTTNTGWPHFGQSLVPTNLSSCTAIAGGWMHTLAVQTNGTVVGWGATTNNVGTVTNQSVPPATLGACTSVGGGYYHSIALRTNQTVVAWGDNRNGQSTVPASLVATKVAAGGYHSIALRTTGTVVCWGAGTVYGGAIPDLGQCVVPTNLGAVFAIAGGGYHTVVIRSSDSTVVCWGSNNQNQCSVPAGLGAVSAISAGDTHTVALKTNGQVVCWGSGLTNAGGQEVGQSIVPPNLGTCSAIAAGGLHTLALRTDGSVVAWGSTNAPIGTDPNFGQSIVPAHLAAPGSAVLIAGGGRHSVVVSKVRRVPSQYATIQAAIDAAASGDRIEVAPGTYNQSFALNGKNVVVRGSTNPSTPTIIDGIGLTTSIVTINGGPATSGLEHLHFTRGGVGQPINPPAYNFTGGGAVFAKDSDAFVRNCSFTSCDADFGGAMYFLRCTMNVDACTFGGTNFNFAGGDGGAILAYASSGVVRNSTFTNNRCATLYPGSGSAFKAVGIRSAGTTVNLESCTISGNPIPPMGAAVEYYENLKILPGVLRIVDTDIVSNIVGPGTPTNAGGLRILGRQQSCVLASGTVVCGNTPDNVVGPYLVEGSFTVCDCEADLSGNGQIEAADLGILLSVWGTSPSNGQGDLNHDGIVNASDLSALLVTWGGNCGG